jgi:hypothetical protein
MPPPDVTADVGVMFCYRTTTTTTAFPSTPPTASAGRKSQRITGFSTLAVNARGYSSNQRLNLTIELKDSLIQAYLNGERLVGVSDSRLTSAMIAL